MSLPLLQPSTATSFPTSIALTAQAPSFLKSQSTWLAALPYPLSLLTNTESQEKWQIYENLFLASLRTGADATAWQCLEALVARFGKTNDRVIALHGLYLEATAKDEHGLAAAMRLYEEVLIEDPTKFSIRKRRAALLRSAGKTADAAQALVNILDASPTDAEAWAELADLYLSQGAFDQAVFSLEEVLLVMPNAWNMHAKLGEVLYLQASRTESAGEKARLLAESFRRFCRSVELCDDYLRGYYGLKLVRTEILFAHSGVLINHLPTDINSPPRTPLHLPKATTKYLRSLDRRPRASFDRDSEEAERHCHRQTR